MTKKKKKTKKNIKWGAGEVLVAIGAFVGLILAILSIIPGHDYGSWSVNGALTIVWALVDIVLCILVMIGLGLIKTKAVVSHNWFLYLVLGIIILALNSNWGGLIIIIGAILMAVF
ncbi:MAG: hypothetical protein ACTSYS_06085 [Promethearchaeota archaeon]